MKIKKIDIISIAFFIFCFIGTFIFSFTYRLNVELIPNSINKYRFLITLKNFINILPAIFFTCAITGWSLDFGDNAGNSRLRFSHAMMERLRSVFITAILYVAFFTFALEICNPIITGKIKKIEELPSLMKEYQNSSEIMFNSNDYELSYKYAKMASKIDPSDKKNQQLLFRSEKALDEKANISKSIIQSMNELTFGDTEYGIPKKKTEIPTEPFETYKLLQTAKQCMNEKDYFGAHYYSQQALRAAAPRDINITECKQISAAAWNILSQSQNFTTTEEQNIFAKKYEGYVALVNGDFVHAYYVFHTLFYQSKELSIDSDVVRYLDITQKALNNQYFFYDETFNLQGYENANNVYFKIQNPFNQITNIYYINGVTSTGKAANMIQYLRGLTVVSLSPEGDYLSGFYVPYAKMKNVEIKYIEPEMLETFNLSKNVKTIPYILLNSVDRNLEGISFGPENIGGAEELYSSGYIILPIPFNDFDVIKEASKGADAMSLNSLLNFYNSADKYGFSKEVFCHSLINRLLQPLFYLVLFLTIAIVSWHCRINEDTLFKFHWIYVFPLLLLIFISLHEIVISFYKFVNFSILGSFGSDLSLLIGFLIYALFLIFASIGFMAGHNAGGK